MSRTTPKCFGSSASASKSDTARRYFYMFAFTFYTSLGMLSTTNSAMCIFSHKQKSKKAHGFSPWGGLLVSVDRGNPGKCAPSGLFKHYHTFNSCHSLSSSYRKLFWFTIIIIPADLFIHYHHHTLNCFHFHSLSSSYRKFFHHLLEANSTGCIVNQEKHKNIHNQHFFICLPFSFDLIYFSLADSDVDIRFTQQYHCMCDLRSIWSQLRIERRYQLPRTW